MARIISFNINGIRARQHQLEAIKTQLDPDIMGLQETKVHDDAFPLADVESLGWHVEFFGQKSHYGVALASKTKPEFVQKGFPSDDEESQKRFIHCRYDINGTKIDVINGYFPQGENRKHETKFPAKEKFYQDLNHYLDNDLKDAEHIVVMGDMNISPEDTDIGIGPQTKSAGYNRASARFYPRSANGIRHYYPETLPILTASTTPPAMTPLAGLIIAPKDLMTNPSAVYALTIF